MAEEVIVDKSPGKEEIYRQLIPRLESLMDTDEPVLSSLCNITAALKEAFDKISWVGFYINNSGILCLGPFQGKVACTAIKMGKGVCGTAAAEMNTIVVGNVEKFPGHIACDADSKSEIVVPIEIEGRNWGVLDLDSYEYSSFDQTDKKYLEQICKILGNKLNLGKFTVS
jgi:GAF domain-containing protein